MPESTNNLQEDENIEKNVITPTHSEQPPPPSECKAEETVSASTLPLVPKASTVVQILQDDAEQPSERKAKETEAPTSASTDDSSTQTPVEAKELGANVNAILDSLPSSALPTLADPASGLPPLPPLDGQQPPMPGASASMDPMSPTPSALVQEQPTAEYVTPPTGDPLERFVSPSPAEQDQAKQGEAKPPAEDGESTLHIARPPEEQRALLRALPEEVEDADLVFEEIVQSLEPDEFSVMEVLGTAKRMFWAPLRGTTQQLAFENIVAFLHTLDLSPLRGAILELARTIANELGDIYQNHLDGLQQEGSLTSDELTLYHLTSTQKERILGDIRSPFREFIERLELLDEAQEDILNLLHEHISTQLGRLPPLLTPELKQQIDQMEEAQGIEASWKMLLQAMMAGLAYYQTEAGPEVQHLFHATEQFIAQFEPTYTVLLNRIIELWSDQLMPPLKALTEN